jgi:hypothetical protein
MADNKQLKPSQKKETGLTADNKHKAQPNTKANGKASKTSNQKTRTKRANKK